MKNTIHPFRARNIILFALAAASAGWLGWGLNRALGLSDPSQNLGMLVFLLLPFPWPVCCYKPPPWFFRWSCCAALLSAK